MDYSDDARGVGGEAANWNKPSTGGIVWSEPVTQVTREELDAKLERTEARVESTLAELRADNAAFKAEVVTKLSNMPTKGFIIGATSTIIATIIAMYAIGAAMFGNGVMVTTASVDKANEAVSLSEENAKHIQALGLQVQSVLNELRQNQQPKTAPTPSE